MFRKIVLLGASLVTLGMVAFPVPPAHAIHLFPTLPDGTDPLGHTCGQTLSTAPAAPDAVVHVNGFFFNDSANLLSTTNITAGQSVTWTWDLWHCHSITFSDGSGTLGGPNALNQPQLARPNGDANSFTLTFTTPGTYSYYCVHHASVGMVGTVVVT